jgi:hypothetical protein
MVRFIAYMICFAILVKGNMWLWSLYQGKEAAYGMLGLILANFIGFPILFGLVERITGPNVEAPYVEPEVFGSRLVARVPESDSNELL